MTLPVLDVAKLLEVGAAAADELHTSAAERGAQKLALVQTVVDAHARTVEAQARIIEEESKHPKAQWRPLLGKVLTVALGWNLLLQPLLVMAVRFIGFWATLFGWVESAAIEPSLALFEPLPWDERAWALLTVVIGGYVGGRSIEKVASTASEANLFGRYTDTPEAAQARLIDKLAKRAKKGKLDDSDRELLERLVGGGLDREADDVD